MERKITGIETVFVHHNMTEHIQQPLAEARAEWLRCIQRRLQTHGISLTQLTTSERKTAYAFSPFNENTPDISPDNLYTILIVEGIDSHTGNKIFGSVDGTVEPDETSSRAIAAGIKALSEGLSIPCVLYNSDSPLGPLVSSLDTKPAERVKQIFDEVMSTPSSS